MEWTMMVLSKFLFFYFLGNQTKTEKELRDYFAWVWEWGLWNLWFFKKWCFYAEFYGFMNFICWRLCCWLKDEKIWVWVVILYIWVLWFEKIWEDLLLSLCLCSCWRWFVFGWQKRVRKCKKIWACVFMFKI